jgi:aryl-alcohol dehydrogenase-like predicted oxidoreductase
MTFGDQQASTYGDIDKSTVMDILDRFYDAGGNFIDTANVYQHGQSEEWIGEWMAKRGNRDEIVLATKYSGHFPDARGLKGVQSNWGGNGSKSLKVNFEASLKRLGTDYIDLFYVHWYDEHIIGKHRSLDTY